MAKTLRGLRDVEQGIAELEYTIGVGGVMCGAKLTRCIPRQRRGERRPTAGVERQTWGRRFKRAKDELRSSEHPDQERSQYSRLMSSAGQAVASVGSGTRVSYSMNNIIENRETSRAMCEGEKCLDERCRQLH